MTFVGVRLIVSYTNIGVYLQIFRPSQRDNHSVEITYAARISNRADWTHKLSTEFSRTFDHGWRISHRAGCRSRFTFGNLRPHRASSCCRRSCKSLVPVLPRYSRFGSSLTPASERKNNATQKIFSGAVCRVVVNRSVISQRGCSHRRDMESFSSGWPQYRGCIHVRQRVNQHVWEYRHHERWDGLLRAGFREADGFL